MASNGDCLSYTVTAVIHVSYGVVDPTRHAAAKLRVDATPAHLNLAAGFCDESETILAVWSLDYECCENYLRYEQLRCWCFPCFPVNVVGFLIWSLGFFPFLCCSKIYELVRSCCGYPPECEVFFLTDQALHRCIINQPDEEQLRLATTGNISTIRVQWHAKAGLQEIQCVCAHDGKEFFMKEALENEMVPEPHCRRNCLSVFQPCVHGEPTLLVYIPPIEGTSNPVANICVGPFEKSDSEDRAGPHDVFMCGRPATRSMAKEPESCEEAATMIRKAKAEHSQKNAKVDEAAADEAPALDVDVDGQSSQCLIL